MKKLCLFFLFTLLINANARNNQEDWILELANTSRQVYQNEQNNFSKQFNVLQKIRTPDSSYFDQYYYELNFIFTVNPNNMDATVTGYFRSSVDSLEQIKLNFDSRDGLPAWNNLLVTGDVNSYDHSNWVLRLNLDRPYNIDETFSITFRYSGVPRSSGLKGFGFDTNSSGDLVIATLSEPYQAQTWWPCKDDPVDRLDSVKITVTVPEDLIVASNGLLQSVTSTGNQEKTYVWKEKYPITTYLVSLAISNYTTFSDSFEFKPGQFLPIDYFVYPQNYETAVEAFKNISAMMQVYSEVFGPYPFLDVKYGHAEFQWGGAMEHQTCTSIGNVGLSWETVYAHELAHQWFGDLVTCHDWSHIWMNEGFATFSEAVWIEKKYGKTDYHTYINSSLGSMDAWALDPVYRYSTDNPRYIFSYTVYAKGMWVLHMLRRVLGDSIFFEIMHDYPYEPAFAFKDVTTEQFRDYCELKSGMKLDWFFQEWIYEPYFPRYLWEYSHIQKDYQNYLSLEIKQVQNLYGFDHLFKMPIDIDILYDNGMHDTLVVWDSLASQKFEIPISGTPQQVTFDPENWILKRVDNDPNVIIPSFELYQNYPNPFNGETTIRFSLDKIMPVNIEIFDITGRKVRTISKQFFSDGFVVSWDGGDDNGDRVASGVYIYRIRLNGIEKSRKMLLVR